MRTWPRRPTLTITQRLFLGLLPAVLAMGTAVGLAYYGQYARTAPEIVVVGSVVLAVLSFLFTWFNARRLSARISRLAELGEAGAPSRGLSRRSAEGPDELERIEQAVGSLGTALTTLEGERTRAEQAASERLYEHATVLAATVRSTLAQLDEVRLPLHILLEAKFGDLNENQEELLGAARDAADTMDGALRRLGQVADVDRGALTVQRQLVQVNDVVRAVLPLAHAAVARRGARLETSLEPGLPRAMIDRVRLAEALALLIEAVADRLSVDRSLVIATAREECMVVISLTPGQHTVLANRLIEAQGGRLESSGSTLAIRLAAPESAPL